MITLNTTQKYIVHLKKEKNSYHSIMEAQFYNRFYDTAVVGRGAGGYGMMYKIVFLYNKIDSKLMYCEIHIVIVLVVTIIIALIRLLLLLLILPWIPPVITYSVAIIIVEGLL